MISEVCAQMECLEVKAKHASAAPMTVFTLTSEPEQRLPEDGDINGGEVLMGLYDDVTEARKALRASVAEYLNVRLRSVIDATGVDVLLGMAHRGTPTTLEAELLALKEGELESENKFDFSRLSCISLSGHSRSWWHESWTPEGTGSVCITNSPYFCPGTKRWHVRNQLVNRKAKT